MIRTVITASAILLIVCAVGCGTALNEDVSADSIKTYIDVPGVTEHEISIIEALKDSYGAFSYGQMLETESFMQSNGAYAGFSALFCEFLTEFFGIDFNLEIYDGDSLTEGINSRRIDFTGDFSATPANVLFYAMSHPIAERGCRLFTHVDNNEIMTERDIKGTRLGFLLGGVSANNIREHYPDLVFTAVVVDNFADAANLLMEGEIDAFVAVGVVDPVFDLYGSISSKGFFPLVLTPVSLSTANKALRPFIDVINKYIAAGGTDKLYELYRKGEEEYSRYKLDKSLTTAERVYLRKLRERDEQVNIVLEQENYPISFYNKSEKEFQGVAVDVLAEISKLTGIVFKTVNNEKTTTDEMLYMLVTRKASMISQWSPRKGRENNFLLGPKPYGSTYYALLSKLDYPNMSNYQIAQTRVGVVANTVYEENYYEWFPTGKSAIVFDSTEKALAALEKDEIDMLLGTDYFLLMQQNYYEKPGFKVNLRFGILMDFYFGFNNEEEILCSIIGKAQDFVKTDVLTYNWTSRGFDYSKKLAEQRSLYLMGVVFCLCLMLALTVFSLMRTRKFNQDLGILVNKRTEELAHQTQAAQLASRSKSDFLANMSHEIRTPMNAIIGMTNIGKTASDVDRMMYCFSKIEDASRHLLGIINDILDMSKIEAGKFDLSSTEFNFEKMLQRVVSVMNFRIEERQQKLTVYLDRAIPKNLIGDDIRLAQVITNLLGNAVKFTPEKGFIRIGTQFLGETDGVCTIQIFVTDTGIGISPEQQTKLFKSYQQADSSTTRKFGGTGLGLAISKNIVEMMGGKIWIESEIGAGSKFAFSLQAKRGAEEADEDIDWESVRLLAVDGDPYVLSHFEVMAKQFGFHCEVAENYEEALRYAREHGGFNFCFVNWKLHNIDGLRLAKLLKKENPDIVEVLMVTASKWNEIEEEARNEGVDKFLAKPLFPSAVAEIVGEYFGRGEKKDEPQQEEENIFAGHRIMLVEDVELNREVVIALLEPTGIAIDCAENGAEAVHLFETWPDMYEMIFMDVFMPEMDGLEATRNIRAFPVPAAKSIPIIAMTANVFQEDIEKCLDAGMNGHVGKPIDCDRMLEVLRKYLLA